MFKQRSAAEIQKSWSSDPRWQDVQRNFTADDVVRLRGTVHVEHTLARRGAERLWHALSTRPPVRALGALTGNQAVQQVAAGLDGIYLSGWQVAADANTSGHMYPDQSLYPADSVPHVVKRVNQALQRADQIAHMAANGNGSAIDWFAPIVADAEAGFGGDLNAFELMKGMIEAGAAGVHFEDQLASAKKCGHMGGKVLVPTREFIQKLQAARLAADRARRADAGDRAHRREQRQAPDQRRRRARPRVPRRQSHRRRVPRLPRLARRARSRAACAYAPYADLLWCETSTPDLDEARRFAEAVHAEFPRKLLAYNCSPSFNWSKHLGAHELERFQRELALHGYAFQFVTLAGFHALNLSMFELARGYRDEGMAAYARLQDREFDAQARRRLRRGQASELRGHRLLRRDRGRDQRRRELDRGAQGLDRGASVLVSH